MSFKSSVFIFLLGTICAWILLFAYDAPSAFGRDTADNSFDVERRGDVQLQYAELEQEHTERLLERLARHEASLLSSEGSSSPRAFKKSPAETYKLAETLKAKKVLEAQQREFVREIGSLKQQMRKLKDRRPKAPIIRIAPSRKDSTDVEDAFLERIAKLKMQLTKERTRAEQLERKVQSVMRRADGKTVAQLGLVETLQKQNSELSEELAALKAQAVSMRDQDGELGNLKQQLSRASEEIKACEKGIEESEEKLAKLPEIAEQYKHLKGELAKKNDQSKLCLEQLDQSSKLLAKLAVVEKGRVSEDNQNLMLETASRLLDDPPIIRTKVQPKARGRMKTRSSSLKLSPALAAAVSPQQDVAPAPTGSDVMIVEAARNKINLRSGPGREHSPLMQVQVGTRLTVESREGDWFRVVAPTGGRAYVRRDVVRAAAEVSPTGRAPQKTVSRAATSEREVIPFGSVKLGGNPANDLESRALEHIRKGLGARGAQNVVGE